MSTLVVYESFFGNTWTIAEAVAGELDVVAVPVADAPSELPAGLTLLVVGAPTHNMGLPNPISRDYAAEAGADPAGAGIAEWLQGLQPQDGLRVAAFDTATSSFQNSASTALCDALRKAGFDEVLEPEVFKVTGTQGPLVGGEQERARRWARLLVEPSGQ